MSGLACSLRFGLTVSRRGCFLTTSLLLLFSRLVFFEVLLSVFCRCFSSGPPFLECSSFSFFVSRFPTLCCVGSLLPLAGFFSFPWFWTCCLFLFLVLHKFACFLPAFGFQVFYRPLPLLSNPLRRYTTVVSCVCVTFFLLLIRLADVTDLGRSLIWLRITIGGLLKNK